MSKLLPVMLSFLSTIALAQNDLVVGTSYPLNIQHKNSHSDGFVLQNARYHSGDDVLQWETSHASYGLRGIRFNYNSGIHFYASNNAVTAGATFSPVTRFFIGNAGNIGIGTTTPGDKLHILNGNITVDNGNIVLNNGNAPSLATGAGASELGRYLRLINSTTLPSPTGLKAGGVLIADDFNYANPAKTDLVVKGRVGIGTPVSAVNSYALAINGTLNAAGLYVNDQLYISSQWTTSNSTIFYNGAVGIGTSLSNNPNNYTLAVNGKIGAKDVHVEKTSATWPDYVLETGYPLRPLHEVEKFIAAHKHLPEVPAAREIEENGYLVGNMDAVLLKKIEELTLYILQQQKEIETLKEKLNDTRK